jgi:hypothetical protein
LWAVAANFELHEITMAQAADAVQNFLLIGAPPPWRRRALAFVRLQATARSSRARQRSAAFDLKPGSPPFSR